MNIRYDSLQIESSLHDVCMLLRMLQIWQLMHMIMSDAKLYIRKNRNAEIQLE